MHTFERKRERDKKRVNSSTIILKQHLEKKQLEKAFLYRPATCRRAFTVAV